MLQRWLLEIRSGDGCGCYVQGTTAELTQARERTLVLAQQMEKLGAELRDKELQMQQKEAQLATTHAAAEQRKRTLMEDAEKLHREKSKRARLEEEKQVGCVPGPRPHHTTEILPRKSSCGAGWAETVSSGADRLVGGDRLQPPVVSTFSVQGGRFETAVQYDEPFHACPLRLPLATGL